ncbi:MAG: lipopolysaccharide kinase InaA family protein [Planctomycetota bacterium]
MTVNDDIPQPLRAVIEREGLTTCAGAFAYGQGDDLHKPGLGHRRRTRIELTDDEKTPHVLFLKRYGAEPLSVRLRRWWTTGVWDTMGPIEYANVRAVRQAGIPTMTELAAGSDEQGRSFVLVTSVDGVSLESRAEDFFIRQHDEAGRLGEFNLALAELMASFHQAGFVHRDFYACHVFMDERGGAMDLSLIDLARVFRPRRRQRRWQVKDLAQLKYSMSPRWVSQCWDEFFALYLGGRGTERICRPLQRAINRRVARMRRRHRTEPFRYEPTREEDRSTRERTRRDD